jgi:hypothetical protein
MMPNRASLISVTVDDSTYWSVDSVRYGSQVDPLVTSGFVVIFSPRGDSSVSERHTTLRVIFRDDSTHSTCTQTATLTGYIKRFGQPPIDTTHLELAADSTQTLHLSSATRVRYIRVDNNTGTSLIIDTAYLADGSHFALERLYPDSAYSFYVPNGTYVAFRVTLLDTLNVYYDTLYVVTEQGLMAIGFPIVGNSTLAGVADPGALGVSMSLSPNPARQNVRIRLKGISSGSVEVLDILGNTVAVTQPIVTGSEQDLTGARNLAAGSYYVRVSGYTESGQPLVLTRRLIIAK